MKTPLTEIMMAEYLFKIRSDVESAVGYTLTKLNVESPIEWAMAYALRTMATGYGWEYSSQIDFVDDFKDGVVFPIIQVVPQYRMGRYKADFAVKAFIDAKPRCLVVECDGHDFHEKTKAQAAHDRKRDRYMQQHGWIVLRFTGSEIHKDILACSDEIMRTLENRHG